MPGYKWVPHSGSCTVSPGMIVAGPDLDGVTLVVGRACHNGEVLPAKAKPEHGVAYVAHGGAEHMKHQFEVLMTPEFHWIHAKNGHVPEGAVESGPTSTGETLFVGRGYQCGTPAVGKVHPSHGCLYIPWDGKEISIQEYEVLVQK